MHPIRSQINTTKLRDAWDLLEAPHLLCAVQGVDNFVLCVPDDSGQRCLG